jgi:hypothetical protein
MKWDKKQKPKPGDVRFVKQFLFFPKCLRTIGNSEILTYKWLETVYIKQAYTSLATDNLSELFGPEMATSEQAPRTQGATEQADNARVSGHAEQAADLLRKLLREHRGDASVCNHNCNNRKYHTYSWKDLGWVIDV